MASYVPAKKGVELILYIGLDSVATANEFQTNPTLASGDFKVSIDGGTLTNLATLPTVTPSGGKMVKVTLSASEMNGDNITLVCHDASGAEWKNLIINIPTATRQIDDLATPTNITAGTITTVTNLTNAPTNGDLTATMKTSVTTAATAATPTAAAVTGAVGSVTGNVGGSVASVTAGVTLADGAITAAKIATDAIDADALAADAVTEIQSGLPAAVWTYVVEGALTAVQAYRIMLSVLTGKSTGGGTTSVAFRDMADSKNRVDATVDADGNRTAVSRDGT